MIEADRVGFIREVNRARNAFDKPKIDADTAQTWWDVLHRLTLSDVTRALDIHIQRGKYAPRPSDIYRRATGDDQEARAVGKGSVCEYVRDGSKCGEPWVIQTDKGLCRAHYDQVNRLRRKDPDFGGHSWRDLFGAFRAIEVLGEPRTRCAYGSDAVDYVLAHASEFSVMVPPRQQKDSKPLAGAIKNLVEKVYGPVPEDW